MHFFTQLPTGITILVMNYELGILWNFREGLKKKKGIFQPG
jgi:hypothetical protein